MKHLAGGWALGVGEQPKREKGACGQSAGVQMTCPETSMVGKTAPIRGRQEELPAGGRRAWDGERWGGGRVLPSERRTGPARGGDALLSGQSEGSREGPQGFEVRLLCAQGDLHQVTGEEPLQVSVPWSGAQEGAG